MPDSKIKVGIEKYLKARKNILKLGREHPERFGGNDNIIGRIGEHIALSFLESLGQKPLKMSNSNNPGYDLVEKRIKTQVKVITSENQRGRSVKLRKSWNQFVLIELGEHYKPEKIGVLTEKQHNKALKENERFSRTPTVSLTMLGPNGLIGRYGTIYEKDEIAI